MNIANKSAIHATAVLALLAKKAARLPISCGVCSSCGGPEVWRSNGFRFFSKILGGRRSSGVRKTSNRPRSGGTREPMMGTGFSRLININSSSANPFSARTGRTKRYAPFSNAETSTRRDVALSGDFHERTSLPAISTTAIKLPAGVLWRGMLRNSGFLMSCSLVLLRHHIVGRFFPTSLWFRWTVPKFPPPPGMAVSFRYIRGQTNRHYILM